ncbi:MAG: hypothetical protein KGZ39_02615 [Simkania sp.]|nr:hypothetical protein [Simkania sp.]
MALNDKNPKKILVSMTVPVQSAEKNNVDRQKWQGLKNFQILTFQRSLPESLEYHFANFKRLEAVGAPELSEHKYHTDEEWVEIRRARENIKFEVQAYLCQLRRAKHFINNLKITAPEDLELKEVWDSILNKDGMTNVLANKWATHRSVDNPENETDTFHTEILLSLDGASTSWSSDNHLILLLSDLKFNLCDFHPKVIKFTSWLFSEAEKLYQPPVAE